MFYSQCLLSRKGPLGAIWVAAYCFKKLNKALVFETDIPSSVDKILQDEIDATTYRVLAYLLLGVVRIYSKKVEYLFEDCHEALVQINAFVVDKNVKARVDALCAPYHSITLPERFELDAFDLDILEDVDGGNMLPEEAIMLKDGSQKTERRGNFLDEYHCEDLADCHDTFSADHTLMEDVCSSYFMDINMETSTLNLSNLVEKIQGDCFSRDEHVNPETFSGVGKEPPDLDKQVSENKKNHEEHVGVAEMAESGKQMHVEASSGKFQDNRVSQGECVNVELCQGLEEEPLDTVKPIDTDHLIDGECINVPDTAELETEMHQVVNEDRFVVGQDHDLGNTQTGIEKLEDNGYIQEMDLEEKLPELRGSRNVEAEDGVEVTEMAESGKQIHVEASTGKFQGHWLAKGECVNVELVQGLDEEPQDPVKPTDTDYRTDGECINVLDTAEQETEMHQVVNEDHRVVHEDHALSNTQTSVEKLEDNGYFQEMDLEVEKKFPELNRPYGEDHHPDTEQIETLETTLSEKHPEMTLSEMKRKILIKDNPLSITLDATPQSKLSRAICKRQILRKDNPLSITLDATPQSKLSRAIGAATPKVMDVHTPAIKERSRLSKKRKCLLDDVLVFPNDVIRQCIEDPSDLVAKRRKVPGTTLTAWKAHRISNLPQGFFEPVVPCISSELSSLFHKNRFTVLESIKFAESQKNSGASESPAADRFLEKTVAAPVKMDKSDAVGTDRSLEKTMIASETVMTESPTVVIAGEQTAVTPETDVSTLAPIGGRSSEQMVITPETNASETLTSDRSLQRSMIAPDTDALKTPVMGRSSEQMVIAPETNASMPPTLGRSLERLMIAPELAGETVALATPIGGVSSEQMSIASDTDVLEPPTLDRSLEHTMIAPETPARRLVSMRTFEIPDSPKTYNSDTKKELTMSEDKQLSFTLIDECINSFEGDTQELYGLSERTRMVAKHLDKSFLKQNKGEEAVGFLQLVKERTKKESARLFYEILVLVTKGYANVKQDAAYGDFLVGKLPQWEHVFGADDRI